MPGMSGRRDAAVDDRAVVGEAAERREDLRVDLVAAEPRPTAMLSANWWPPCGTQRRGDQPCALQHVDRAQVLDQAVGQRRVELQDVAVGPQPAVADQVARVLHREQVLAGGERRRVARRPGPRARR